MKKIIIVIVLSFIATSCFAQVRLFRYVDKVTGEDRGICYSDKDGNSAINNPNWDYQEIREGEKESFISLQQSQIKDKEKTSDQKRAVKKEKAITKLKSLGLTGEEIEAIIN